MNIRPEDPAEFAAIYDFIKTAFLTAEHHDGDEQDFAERLRTGKGYIPDLALVAEQNGQIIGHIMLTRFHIATQVGNRDILLVAPLLVAFGHRSEGVGSALMHEAICRAGKLGHTVALLIGDPAYYSRFGFRQSTDLGIRNIDEIPDCYVQALELTSGALRGVEATVTFEGL